MIITSDPTVSLVFGQSKPLTAEINVCQDGVAVISNGWAKFAKIHRFREGDKYAFKFDKFGAKITLVVKML